MIAQTTTIRLLHLDDEPGALATTENYFERFREDVTIETTTDPEAALERLTEEPTRIDCLLCDYEMPAMDGFTVHERLQAADVDVPFVLYTGKGSGAVESEARSRGVTAYVEKDEGMDHLEALAERIEQAVRDE